MEVRAPRGTAYTAQGWPQEAAKRMLMNNLDPDVAERPEDLVVYGGTGRAARDCGRSTPSSASWTRWPATRRCWCSPADRWACSARTSGRRGC